MKSQFAQNRAARWMAHFQQWRESGLAKTRYCREKLLGFEHIPILDNKVPTIFWYRIRRNSRSLALPSTL